MVIVENNIENLEHLTNIVKVIYPRARIKGFVDGDEAISWCNQNAFSIDWYIGNWCGTNEECNSPEGANVFHLVNWYKEPKKILIAEEPMFEKWSYEDGAAGFILRPATMEKVKEIFDKQESH